jgi:hypothetical protein
MRMVMRYRPTATEQVGASRSECSGEWIALEHRDIDKAARVAYVRRAFSKGTLRCTKTEASVRAVPLQAIALAALDHLPTQTRTSPLFPTVRGGYLDLHNFRNRN